MNAHSTHGPLVATDLDDAAALMISEGSPVSWPPRHAADSERECCDSWLQGIRAFVDRHPLPVLLTAFAVGVAGGFSSSWSCEDDG